jgi:hypothetical protein
MQRPGADLPAPCAATSRRPLRVGSEPSEAKVRPYRDPQRERMRRRYVASMRHTLEVDFEDDLYALGNRR